MSDQSGEEIREDRSVGDEDDDGYFPIRIPVGVKEVGEMRYLIEGGDWPIGAATTEPKCNFEDNPGLLA